MSDFILCDKAMRMSWVKVLYRDWRVAPENDAQIIVLVQFFIYHRHIRNRSADQITGNSFFRGSFVEGLEKFSHRRKAKISNFNLMITVVYTSLFFD